MDRTLRTEPAASTGFRASQVPRVAMVGKGLVNVRTGKYAGTIAGNDFENGVYVMANGNDIPFENAAQCEVVRVCGDSRGDE